MVLWCCDNNHTIIPSHINGDVHIHVSTDQSYCIYYRLSTSNLDVIVMLSVWLKVNWNGNILTCTRNECFQDKIVLYTLYFDVYQELIISLICWAPLHNNDQDNGVNTDNGAGFYILEMFYLGRYCGKKSYCSFFPAFSSTSQGSTFVCFYHKEIISSTRFIAS